MINTKRVGVLLACICLMTCHHSIAQKPRVLIDADTGNEVDDLFAISRALISDKIEIVGLNSTQWQNSHWAIENTLENSHRLNVRILAYLDMLDIPHPRGSHFRLYDWGQDRAQHSAAAYHIIKEAHKSTPENKLNVIALGALTNVASAIMIDPSIAPKIRLYFLGTSYNFDTGIWRKDRFNCLMDPHAINIVLDQEDLEMHITPAEIAADMRMTRQRLSANFQGKDDLRGFLYDRWMSHLDGGYNARVIWDLVPIYLLLRPDWLTEVNQKSPPENTSRQVFVTKTFEADKLEKDFFESMGDYFK